MQQHATTTNQKLIIANQALDVTLWFMNIAMENGPIYMAYDDLPVNNDGFI